MQADVFYLKLLVKIHSFDIMSLSSFEKYCFTTQMINSIWTSLVLGKDWWLTDGCRSQGYWTISSQTDIQTINQSLRQENICEFKDNTTGVGLL